MEDTNTRSTADALERLADIAEAGISVNLNISVAPDFVVPFRSEASPPTAVNGALRSQRAVVIWLAIVAFVLTALFPPWTQGASAGAQVPLGWAPMWSPPKPQYAALRIDLQRLLIEWFLVSSVSAGLLLTLEKVVVFVSTRRKALRSLVGTVALYGIWLTAGPQLLDTYRRYGTDYKKDERSSAWTTYADGIAARFPDAKVSAQGTSSSLEYLGHGRYRASSYVESPDFSGGRLYFTTTLRKEAPAQVSAKWLIEASEVRNAPGQPAVPELEIRAQAIIHHEARLSQADGRAFWQRMLDLGVLDAEVAKEISAIEIKDLSKSMDGAFGISPKSPPPPVPNPGSPVKFDFGPLRQLNEQTPTITGQPANGSASPTQ